MDKPVDDRAGVSIVPTLSAPQTEFPYPLQKRLDSASREGLPGTTPTVLPGLSTSDRKTTTPVPSTPLVPSLPHALGDVASAPETDARPVLAPEAETEAITRAPRVALPDLKRGVTGGRPSATTRISYHHFGSISDSDSSSSSSEDEWDVDARKRKKKEAQVAKAIERKRRKDKRKGSLSAPYSKFNIGNENFNTKGKVSRRDGRLKISVNETANTGYLAKAVGTGIKRHFGSVPPTHVDDEAGSITDGTSALADDIFDNQWTRPRLNIVVMVIGSRGDIQPFLKIGKILKEDYGHRIRIATHPTFKEFIEKDSGLEFFSVGGDPSELMSFMVKNPGLIPSLDTVKAGEIGRRRHSMFQMFKGMWRACINATDDELDQENMKMMGDKHPFVADCIIANPPSFAHVHIAERLGIPLHMMFTFPYTPTTKFAHPLANIKKTNVEQSYTNFMSYPLVELMVWQGLGDLVNKFRIETLGLEPVSTLWAPGQLYRLHVPYSYLWSPALVPKPEDWGPEIDIAGFVFLDLASSFKPPDELAEFLKAGPPPVYIGFGSIVVDDPYRFTELIFKAIKLAGVRALVSKGWGGLGGNIEIPEGVFMLENTPHDWLFPKVSAAIHHGGAGTTAIGLKCGVPTMIVPFFGDQPFWGEMVSKARAGAFECIPYKKLTAEKLAEGITQCLTVEAKQNAAKIAESIAKEGDGAMNAVKSFHRSLPLMGERNMRCSILSNRVSVWQMKGTHLKLSALAADILVEKKKLRWKDLRLARHYDWDDFAGAGEPITGAGAAIVGTVGKAGKGLVSIPLSMAKSVKHRKQHEDKKRKWADRQSQEAGRPEEHAQSQSADANGPKRPPQRQETNLSTLSADPSENLVEELAEDAGRGFAQTGASIVKAPMDLALSIAQGFHNAPRLYGDETVRKPVRITGIKSGLRASRNEFFFGIYDGFTGVVTQPYHGAKENGVLGCIDGMAMGLGGLVLKNIAAVIGPFAYTAKGVHKELVKNKQPTAFIRKARIIQGGKELKALKVASEYKNLPEFAQNANKASIYAPRGGETLKDVEDKVDDGWNIVVEIMDGADTLGHEGIFRLRGRMALRRERMKWHEAGALESIGMAERALKAKKEGKDVRQELKKHKEQEEKKSRKLQRSANGNQDGTEVRTNQKSKVDDTFGKGSVLPNENQDSTEERTNQERKLDDTLGMGLHLPNGKNKRTTDVADFAKAEKSTSIK